MAERKSLIDRLRDAVKEGAEEVAETAKTGAKKTADAAEAQARRQAAAAKLKVASTADTALAKAAEAKDVTIDKAKEAKIEMEAAAVKATKKAVGGVESRVKDWEEKVSAQKEQVENQQLHKAADTPETGASVAAETPADDDTPAA